MSVIGSPIAMDEQDTPAVRRKDVTKCRQDRCVRHDSTRKMCCVDVNLPASLLDGSYRRAGSYSSWTWYVSRALGPQAPHLLAGRRAAGRCTLARTIVQRRQRDRERRDQGANHQRSANDPAQRFHISTRKAPAPG